MATRGDVLQLHTLDNVNVDTFGGVRAETSGFWGRRERALHRSVI